MNRINIPPFYLLLSVIALFVLNYTIPLMVLFYPPFNYFGVVIIFSGLALVLWHADYFKRYETPIKPFEHSTHLIKEGMYKYSRNPIYLGMGAILFGGATVLGSISPFVVVPVFIIFIERAFIVKEEKFLENIFGHEYLDYKKSVRRWL